MARVMPRVAMGTAGSSGSPEAEDAAAMAAFTTRSHELISAYGGDGETTGQLRGRCAEAAALGRGGGVGGGPKRRRQESHLTISSHWRKRLLKAGDMFLCGLHGHPDGTSWVV